MDRPKPEFDIGQRVEVVLNVRNRTLHAGVVWQAIWHTVRRRFFYFIIGTNGKRLSKRYFADDLRPLTVPDPQEPIWDEDSLSYGYVVTQLPEGWWHMHFGRSNVLYSCHLLGGTSNLLARIQRFAPGGLQTSPAFLLTLDGKGLDLRQAEIKFDGRWGDRPVDAELAEEAVRFQKKVMPLLYVWGEWQRATAEIVRRQRYLRVATAGTLRIAEDAAG